MGYVPPPLKLTDKEFERRWKAGARTMKELDPALMKWYKDSQMSYNPLLIIAIPLFILFIILVVWGIKPQ